MHERINSETVVFSGILGVPKNSLVPSRTFGAIVISLSLKHCMSHS